MALLRLPEKELDLDAVGLDVDGVARDSGVLAHEAARKTIEEYGGVPPTLEEYVRDFHYDFLAYYRACGATLTLEQLEGSYWKHCRAPEECPPFPDLGAFLEEIQSRGLKVFTVSAHAEDKVRQWFVDHKLDTHFLHLRGGSRDKVACIRGSCATLGVDLSRTCYVGDWGIDMRAAKEASVLPLGITRGYPTKQALLHNGAAHVIDHLSELADMIR